MIRKPIITLSAVLLAGGLLVLMCNAKIHGSRNKNKHVWILPNNESVEYFEVKESPPGFMASITQYVMWASGTRGTNKTVVGVGGSYSNVRLHLNQEHTIAWITGHDAGQTNLLYLAVLDVGRFRNRWW